MTLTERLQAQLAARTATDPRMRAILRRIRAGTASFSDTALYTRYLGEQLGGILADALPDAAPEEIAEASRVLLREAHADVTAQAAIVQEIQDRQLGASLAAKCPKYPAGRVEKVASSLTDQTVPVEKRQRRARNASANVVASYHDEFIKENARIRSDAGFSCKTVRLGTQCCPWCAKLTGSYPAGSEPRDLFRRHDNCTCTIIYETRRTRQTLRGQGKSWNVVEEVERKAPTRFSRDEAKALQEAEMGRYRGLTNGAGSGMIKSIDVDDYEVVTYGKKISPEVSNVILETMKQCEKDGGFIISDISTKVVSTSAHGTPVLQIEPQPNGLLQLNVNVEYLAGKTLEEVNKAFLETPSTVVNSLEEAVIHESGHAISIKGMTVQKIQALYGELKNAGLPGVSKIALDDGAECLAELEVLRHRGVKVSKTLAAFYKKYMGRDH